MSNIDPADLNPAQMTVLLMGGFHKSDFTVRDRLAFFRFLRVVDKLDLYQ